MRGGGAKNRGERGFSRWEVQELEQWGVIGLQLRLCPYSESGSVSPTSEERRRDTLVNFEMTQHR